MSKRATGQLKVASLVEEAKSRTGPSDFGPDTWQEGLEMAADVMGRIRALYAWLGEELSDVAAQRMEVWWAANSAGRYGARSYDPARFGVDPDELKQRFAFYHDRFPELTRKPKREEQV